MGVASLATARQPPATAPSRLNKTGQWSVCRVQTQGTANQPPYPVTGKAVYRQASNSYQDSLLRACVPAHVISVCIAPNCLL